jgi:3-hydroxypropanoate dehydrogenase
LRSRLRNRRQLGEWGGAPNNVRCAESQKVWPRCDPCETKARNLDTDQVGLDRLFRNARSQNGWMDAPVADDELNAIYDLMKWGPTSANCSPARFLFLKSRSAKERLRPALLPGNIEKTMQAPVVAIVGYDLEFYRQLPKLFPHQSQARTWFEGEGKRKVADETAFRNGSLQGAYLMLAARAAGLDCAPMSGFDNEAVNREFFSGTSVRSNFICGLGRGDPAKLFPRSPRLSFTEACAIL